MEITKQICFPFFYERIREIREKEEKEEIKEEKK